MQFDCIENRICECEVKNFNYGEIERAISEFYDLGGPNSSDFTELEDNSISTVSISFTKGEGKFNILTYTEENGQKMIRCSVIGKLVRKKY